MTTTTVHIINHTHWDREWFLTSVYTSRWIPGLVDKLEQLVAANPNFKFLFDGQTLVIEDLLKVAPDYELRVQPLVRHGHLIVGPYYCQPDWQLAGGELLIRNLQYGRQDMQRFGAANPTGWLVDTFGHIAQAPQIHRLFGIESVFVWRGVPQLQPYFHWQGSDGQVLRTIDLFGGYRNLYGVTHVPEVAIKRLQAEVDKLRPYYPTPDIPLFDGYDLEEDPEDPMSYYGQHLADLLPNVRLEESSPQLFAQTLEDTLPAPPLIAGELNSGKYGATFPGTLSARTYLKIMQHDCETWLFARAEPLATLARLVGRPYQASLYESWGRLLLQNAVHDCLCGVSIDQVHEKSEYHYRYVAEAAEADVRASLAYLLADFAPGTYAVSSNLFAATSRQVVDDRLLETRTEGIGIWPVVDLGPLPLVETPVETFTWQNDHYAATVDADGSVRIGAAVLGRLRVSAEAGDTYTDELGDWTAICPGSGLVIERQNEHHAVLGYTSSFAREEIQVTATVRLTFDSGPLVGWQVDLDSQGTDLRVDLVFETARVGRIFAGMQFDVVERPFVDTDLLPRVLEPDLGRVLLGQRELGAVSSFPFHDFVAVDDGTTTTAVFARGLRAYQATEDGTLTLTLRRAVSWLTAADLKTRVGDAGPFFYVPDAAGERSVRHELGVLVADVPAAGSDLARINAAFQNPPLIVEAHGTGRQREWQFLQEDLPLSSLHIEEERLLARVCNPTGDELTLDQSYAQGGPLGEGATTRASVPGHGLATLVLERALPPPAPAPATGIVGRLWGPAWRVGENHGRPAAAELAHLQANIDAAAVRLAEIEARLETAQGRERYLVQHQLYVVKREHVEYLLSQRLNELKLAQQGVPGEDYLFEPDEAIRQIGLQLNRLRIKRRIYDYVVEAV